MPITELVSCARLASSGVWRFRVGRSGSLDGVEVLDVVVGLVSGVEVSEVRRVMVGRSGSSAGVVEALDVVVELV